MVFSASILEDRPGYKLLRVAGKGATKLFRQEAGGHRWQRIPPTEKRGRVHTSTITVAVLQQTKAGSIQIDKRDLDEAFVRGSGAGGQARNKNSTCVVLAHRPTGIQVRVDGGRSQHHNRQTALEILMARLAQQQENQQTHRNNQKRRRQIGSGMRGDKIRTIRVRDDRVVDHQTGKKMSFRKYKRGHLEDLW